MKKNWVHRLISTVLCLCMLCGLALPASATGTAPDGILNNGLGGIYIDINAEPYTSYAKTTNSAYDLQGCAWFATARVYQKTGIGGPPQWTQRASTNWMRKASSLGLSTGSEPKSNSLACYNTGNNYHIFYIEKIVGDQALISEGGAGGYSDAAHGYCRLAYIPVSKIKNYSSKAAYIGCVYLDDVVKSTDTTPPVISNVVVTGVYYGGYTVRCYVTDDTGVDRVMFPTWTINNGQDDLVANWSTNPFAKGTATSVDASGNGYYEFKVLVNSHLGESGDYMTHIYAYDKDGNYSCYTLPNAVNVPPYVHSHTWNNGVVTKEATCSETGTRTYTCTSCGETKTEDIPMISHTQGESKITTEATCTQAGVRTYYCAVCGAEISTETIPANGHSYDNGVVTKATTCVENGEMTYTCTKCGESKIESIPANGHSYDDGIVTAEATEDIDGVITYTCTVCGAIRTEAIPAKHGHNWNSGIVTKEPTCTEKGEKLYTCTDEGCTESVTVELPATGAHKWDSRQTKEMTCTEPGEITYTCSVCGTVETKEIPAPGHTWDEGTVKIEATCGTAGERAYTCSVCSTTKSEEIPATGAHISDEGKITTAATCENDGVKTYTCTVCGTEIGTEVVPATGHSYDEGIITKAATCTEDGEKTYTCTNCQKQYTEAISATGHSYDEGVVTKAASCTEDGEETYTCSACGKIKIETIAATGHTWDDGVVTKAATAAEAGVKTYTCTVCGETRTEAIPATGSSSSGSSAAQPTATPADTNTYYTCPKCGYHNWTGAEGGYRCSHCGYVETKELGGYANVKGTATKATAAGAAASGTATVPQTGDDSTPLLWSVLCLAGLLGLGITAHARRRSGR